MVLWPKMAMMVVPLLLSACSWHGRQPDSPHDRPDVLLIVLDTLRRDRVSAYGEAAHPTPNLDAFAAQGLRFDQAYANSGWTLPSHASMFTGLYPVAHRATQETLALDETATTLAEVLRDAGYSTFASSGNSVVSQYNGLLQGFDQMVEAFRPAVAQDLGPPHANVVALDRFYTAVGRDTPTFAFLNFVEAHLPYAPPDRFRSQALGPDIDPRLLAQAIRMGMRKHYLAHRRTPPEVLKVLGQLYSGEALWLDWLVGRTLEVLIRHGRQADTLVIITSDHGENLGEHGHLAHVFSLHNTLLHVPLMVRWPSRIAPGVRQDVVQLLDLFPTVLAACGVPAPPHHGRDILGPDAPDADALAFAEYYYPRQVLSVFSDEQLTRLRKDFVPFMLRRRTVQDGHLKLERTSRGGEIWNDLQSDPAEEIAIEATGEAARRLANALDDFVPTYEGDSPLPPPPPIGSHMPGFREVIDDPELLEDLRALGYVE